jgi:hypothetical protein
MRKGSGRARDDRQKCRLRYKIESGTNKQSISGSNKSPSSAPDSDKREDAGSWWQMAVADRRGEVGDSREEGGHCSEALG